MFKKLFKKKYKEPSTLNAVKEFYDVFEIPMKDRPGFPKKDRVKLRIDLLQEELDELKEAVKNNNLVEVADALCDIDYILKGTILEFGLGDKYKALFDEVQRSNMSKPCKTLKEAIDTVHNYQMLTVNTSYKLSQSGAYLVYRVHDKKILKSCNYSPANLKGILNKP